jgi:hypothetical protein
MTAADRIIRWSTALAVLGVAAVAAVVSYEHASALVRVGSYELLMMIIRGSQAPAAAPRPHDGASVIDPLGEQAAVVFASELAADRIPSVRAIRLQYSMLASRVRSGCASTLPQPSMPMAKVWPPGPRG